jgi:hypothetical protein
MAAELAAWLSQVCPHLQTPTAILPKRPTTSGASSSSTAVMMGGAISLLLGAVAGWFGGRMGAVEPTLTARMGLTTGAAGTRRAALRRHY